MTTKVPKVKKVKVKRIAAIWNKNLMYLRRKVGECWLPRSRMDEYDMHLEMIKTTVHDEFYEQYIKTYMMNMSEPESIILYDKIGLVFDIELKRRFKYEPRHQYTDTSYIEKDKVNVKLKSSNSKGIGYWYIAEKRKRTVTKESFEYDSDVDQDHIINEVMEEFCSKNTILINRIIKNISETRNKLEFDNIVTDFFTKISEKYYESYLRSHTTEGTDDLIYELCELYLKQFINRDVYNKYAEYDLRFEQSLGTFLSENRSLLKRLSAQEEVIFLDNCYKTWSKNKISTEELHYYLEKVKTYIR